jgi:hypothetical protein
VRFAAAALLHGVAQRAWPKHGATAWRGGRFDVKVHRR